MAKRNTKGLKKQLITSAVIGLGETGGPLYDVLRKHYGKSVYGYDTKNGPLKKPFDTCDILNICIPYGKKFLKIVKMYQKIFFPTITVIHSTVPVGTTSKIRNAVHSPILGKHGRMKQDIKKYVKWIGGKESKAIAGYFLLAGLRVRVAYSSEETELFKLMCLAKYGMSIAFSYYQRDVMMKYKIPFFESVVWDMNYNDFVEDTLKRPIIIPKDNKKIGGHCVIPGTKLLNKQFPNGCLKWILRYE